MSRYRFAPDNDWLIETMNTVFELGGELVRPQVAQNLMQLIGEGTHCFILNSFRIMNLRASLVLAILCCTMLHSGM